MNTSTQRKRTHRHREQTWGCQVWEGSLNWQFGIQQMQTILYRIDKQQDPIV